MKVAMAPKACWILCTPRTGSSLMCELLNNLGSFPVYAHENMKNRRGPLECGQSFNEWARLFDNVAQFMDNPPPYSKMIYHQYVEAMAGMAKPDRYDVGWYAEKHDKEKMTDVSSRYDSRFVGGIFPDMRYIKLNRETVSHAVSLFIARTTKKYHIYDESSLKHYMDSHVNLDGSKLVDAYYDAVEYSGCWSGFLHGDENLLEIDYHDLSDRTEETMRRVADFLDVDGDVVGSVNKSFGKEKRIYRMTRPEAAGFEERLRRMVKVRVM